MCLNGSVISGKCAGCLAYREKVARLEADNAVLEAALEAQGTRRGSDWHLRDCRFGKRRGGLPPERCSARCTQAHAALSGAGEGWLPPEVREQARLAIGHAFHLIEHNKAMCVRCREAKQRLRAALDKLKEE